MTAFRKEISLLSLFVFSLILLGEVSYAGLESEGSSCVRLIANDNSAFFQSLLKKIEINMADNPDLSTNGHLKAMRDFAREEKRDLEFALHWTQLLEQQGSLEKFAETYDIPKELLPFFDVSKGKFSYQRKNKIILASENGDHELDAARINHEPTKSFELVLEDYLKVLDILPDLELMIVVSESDMAKLEEELKDISPEKKERINIISGDFLSSDGALWAQDSSKTIVSQNGLRATLFHRARPDIPLEVNVYGPRTRALQQSGEVEVIPSSFHFQGGDIIVGAKHVFVGYDNIYYMRKKLRISQEEALETLATEFGKPVIEVGYRNDSGLVGEIDFHIDLTMAIVRDRKTRNETVLLQSDYSLFEDVLGFPSIENMTPAKFSQHLREFVLRLQQEHSADGARAFNEQEKKFYTFLTDINFANLQQIEAERMSVKNFLEGYGYKVVRVPGLAKVGDQKLESIINYTNSIFSGSHALVPNYGIKKLDDFMNQLLSRMGYGVIPMKSSIETILREGCIRCASETYRR